MWSVQLIAVVVAALGNVFLGLFTIVKNPKSATGRLFFLFSFILTAYLLFNYAVSRQLTNEGAFLWIRFVMSNALFINLFFFLLVDTFPQPRMHTKPLILWGSIIATLLLLPVTTTNLIFQTVMVRPGNIDSVPGLGMPAFLLHTLVFLGGGFLFLIQRFRKSRGIEKAQIRLFLLGTVFMFLSLLVTNLLFVLVFNNSTLIGLLPLYTLVFIGCISYAIVRHKFLDINALVARAVVYIVLIVLISIVFSVLVYVLGLVVLQIHFSVQQEVALIGITIFITLVFQSTRQAVQRATDRIFFKGRYDTNDVLNQLSHIMASTLRLEDLSHGLLQILLRELRISKGAIILLQDGLVANVMSEGFTVPLTLVEEDIKQIGQTRDMLNIDEMEEGAVKTVLRSLDCTILVHLRTQGKQIGIIVLGAKSSGDIYSQQDLSLLEILTPEAAVALQNAFAYEEIRRFNITLQEEVDRATSDLRSANVRLQELDKLKDEFVSLASHELRTPLTAIRSYIWMALSGKGGPVPDKQKYYLDRSFLSTNRLIKLVNDMLNISRIESGRVSMSFTKCTLATLVDEVVGEVQPKIEEQKLHLTVTPMDSVPNVIADVDKIKEVLINFISNAIKFTPSGGTIIVSGHVDGDCIKIDVTDSGIGITKEDIPKLFTKFSTVKGGSDRTGQAYQSTGLGLYISKSIVTMHGGQVWVQSAGSNLGSTFSFSLPIYSETMMATMQKKFPAVGLGIIPTQIG